MRLDYALYTIAIILFVVTGIFYATLNVGDVRSLSVISTAALGLLFLALGFALRPRPSVPVSATPSYTPPPPPLATPPEPEAVKMITQEPAQAMQAAIAEKIEVAEEAKTEIIPRKLRLTRLKGVGEKRVKQLTDLGIKNIEDLSKAMPSDLATKLNVSPKITERWIANAKEVVEKA